MSVSEQLVICSLPALVEVIGKMGNRLLWFFALIVLSNVLAMIFIAYYILFHNPMVDRETEVQITEEHFGRFWPLTVDSGELACVKTKSDDKSLLFVYQDKNYALNQSAIDAGYQSIDSIRIKVAGTEFGKSVDNLVTLAEKKC